MDDGTRSARGSHYIDDRRCSVCGGLIQERNKYGICKRTIECNRARTEMSRRAKGIKPRGQNRKRCLKPGCANPRERQGYCAMHGARIAATGDPGPAGSLYRDRIIHVGDTFGRWAALEAYTGECLRILCRCECGTERKVAVDNLRAGTTQSCGCLNGRPKRLRAAKEPYLRAGETYGKLTVLEDADYCTDLVLVRCECGTETTKRSVAVRSGNTRSCGCMRSQRKHGLSRHPLYCTWHGIVMRTMNPKDGSYHNYGGRGIRMYEAWQGMPEGFLRFVADVERLCGPRPADRSLDRYPDKNGNYEPGNIRWATWEEQNGHRRTVGELTQERDELRAKLAATEKALQEAQEPKRRKVTISEPDGITLF